MKKEKPKRMPTYPIIGYLKSIAKEVPEGQRANTIQAVLKVHGYYKEEIWRK